MKAGDVVRLKSSESPHMTVRWVRVSTNTASVSENNYVCEWFDCNNKLNEHEFKGTSLVLVGEPK